MAAETNVKSLSITNRDAVNPTIPISAGLGAPGYTYELDDYAANTTSIGTSTSYYRIVRLPTNVKFKSVVFGTDVAVDTSATASLQMDFNIAFSDSTIDGTPSNLQALVPTTALAGATTTFASYSSPNKIFGSAITQPAANKPWALTDYLLTGRTSTFTIGLLTQQPLWQTFGFTSGQGNNQDPGGFFDFVAYVATAAGTAAAGNLFARILYVR